MVLILPVGHSQPKGQGEGIHICVALNNPQKQVLLGMMSAREISALSHWSVGHGPDSGSGSGLWYQT